MNFRKIAHAQNLKFICTRFIFTILLIGVSSSAICARNLSEYGEGVSNALDLVYDLLEPDLEDAAFDDYKKLEHEHLSKIRALIPASEKIEWKGTTIETDNQWLYENLQKFEREPASSSKREAILTETGERLAALEQKLDETAGKTAANRSKDEDKRKLAEILQRSEYQKPEEKEESLFWRLYRRVAEWIRSFFPRPNISGSSVEALSSFSFILQMLIYALILGVIGFVVYRFAPYFANRFGKREKSGKRERVILGEKLADDANAQSLFDEAERMAREGNLRGAIRKGYVALLCELSERKIIGLSQHKTNRDYLRDVRPRPELYQNMNGLTHNYERHWYGFDAAEEKDWEEFRDTYRKTVNS